MQALRAFEAAARERSLTKAAQSLSLTHGAISHQIKSLEADLGVRLIERAGRGIRLTDEGERFATRVRAAFAELTGALQEIVKRTNPRLLRVSVMPSFAARWLLPRIGRFSALHPDIDLDVSANPVNVDFQRDPADLAVRYGFGEWDGVRVEHLMDDSFFPVCSPRIAGGVPRRPADLARYPLLRADNEPWKPWFEAAGLDWPEPDRGPIFNDSSHVMQAAVEGQGIGLGRATLLGNDERNGVLVRPFAIEVPGARRYFLVYPPRMADSPKLLAFRAWLRTEIAADREADSVQGRRDRGSRGRPGRQPKARQQLVPKRESR
jgi:LysR family glycine cleavage system transcriptional activator